MSVRLTCKLSFRAMSCPFIFLQKLPATVGRSLFVDDLAIWYGAPSVRHVGRQLQLAVTRLQKWSHENGLRFSTAKTFAVRFFRRCCSDPHLGSESSYLR